MVDDKVVIKKWAAAAIPRRILAYCIYYKC
jgi:hypothetical protein